MRTLILTVAAVALALVGTARGVEKEENFFEKTVLTLTLGDPVRADPVILFPLIAGEKPAPLAVRTDLGAKTLELIEPEWPRRRWNVGVVNNGDQPVLMLGGNYLTGGRLDRLLPKDVLVKAKSALEIETLPAQYPKERRDAGAEFRVGSGHDHGTAPAYLRERARFAPSNRLVPFFVSHFAEFRDKGEKRHSLAVVDESRALASFCASCQQAKAADLTGQAKGRVIGYMTAVRGRLHLVEIFGTNRLLKSYFHSTLRAHSFAAAAIELRAKKLGIPIPGHDDPKKTLAAAKKQAELLLAELKKSVRCRKDVLPRGTVGESLLVRTKKSQGAAIGLKGRLVHAVIFPDNPFEKALYSRALELPTEASGDESTFGALSRREGRGTLSEYEKRLLSRMRARR